MASRPRSSARLPCADGAPPYAAASILVNDCGASLPPTEIITEALIDPILTRWGASERLPRAENQCAVRFQLMCCLVRIADSSDIARSPKSSTMAEMLCATLSRSVPRFFKCVPHELLIIAGQLRRPEVECQLVDLPCELERQLVAVIHPRAGIDADIEGLVDCHEECN
jgi:hypothetical protein